MSMTNFRAEDMPGANKLQTLQPTPEPEKKAPAAKKAAAPKKPAAKKAEPKVEEAKAPAQTNTETHGVGPSTVEGKAAEAAKDDEAAE